MGILCDVFQPLGFTEAWTRIRQAGAESSALQLPKCCAAGAEESIAWNDQNRKDCDMVQPEASSFTPMACRTIMPAHEGPQASIAAGPARAMKANLATALNQMQGTSRQPALVPWGGVPMGLTTAQQQWQMQPQSYHEARSFEQDPPGC